jgi:hypothetical protein
MEPTASSSSVNSSAFLRPTLSPSQPNNMPPSTEPASVIATTMPVCGRLILSEFWIGTSRNAMMMRL